MIHLLCMRNVNSEAFSIVGAFSTFELAEEFFKTHEYRGDKSVIEFYIETRRIDVVDYVAMISTLVD